MRWFGKVAAMLGFGKPNPLAQIMTINARVNDGRQYGTKLRPGDLDTDDQTVYDCDNYAHDKLFAQDWPVGVQAQTYDVDLPPVRGQDIGKHRVLVATVNGQDYVLDNMTNAILTKADREQAGWKFSPYSPPKLNMKGVSSLPQPDPATDAVQIAKSLAAKSVAQPPASKDADENSSRASGINPLS